MTSEEILNKRERYLMHNKQYPFHDEYDGAKSVCFWLSEIAFQLSAQNELNAKSAEYARAVLDEQRKVQKELLDEV